MPDGGRQKFRKTATFQGFLPRPAERRYAKPRFRSLDGSGKPDEGGHFDWLASECLVRTALGVRRKLNGRSHACIIRSTRRAAV